MPSAAPRASRWPRITPAGCGEPTGRPPLRSSRASVRDPRRPVPSRSVEAGRSITVLGGCRRFQARNIPPPLRSARQSEACAPRRRQCVADRVRIEEAPERELRSPGAPGTRGGPDNSHADDRHGRTSPALALGLLFLSAMAPRRGRNRLLGLWNDGRPGAPRIPRSSEHGRDVTPILSLDTTAVCSREPDASSAA